MNFLKNIKSRVFKAGNLEFRLLFSFFVILLPLGAIFLSLEQNNANLADTNKRVNHTKNVIATAADVNFLSKKLDNETRGGIITGWKSFKNAFEVNVVIARHKLEHLKHLTADNPEQKKTMDTLESFLEKRISYSRMVFRVREQYGFEAAQKIFKYGYGIFLTSKIKQIIDQIQGTEQSLLVTRQRHNQEALNKQSNILDTLKIILVVIVLLAGFMIYNALKTRRKLEEDLYELNAGLERMVEDRTKVIIEQESHFKSILDAMLEGVQIIDYDYRYVYVNDSVAKHGKTAKEDLLGYSMPEKYPGIEQSEMFKQLQKCLNTRESVFLENEFKYPDGSVSWFELSLQPVPEGVFILSIDITERKRVEAELRKLTNELENRVIERTEQLNATNKELESFSYSVSHDLRAPLRAMDGYAKIMLEDYGNKLDEEGIRVLKVIIKNATQMGMLIDDLLNFSRVGKQSIIMGNIDMNEFCERTFNETKSQFAMQHVETVFHDLPKVRADQSMLRVVLNNLFSNALKYSSGREKSIVEVGSYEAGGQNIFYIRDNGVGFDMNYYDKLFGVFQRLHSPKEFPGTGVGLALVQRIIMRHGGKVWAKSQVNEGATFYFSIPYKN